MNTATRLEAPGGAPLLAVQADYIYKDTIKAQGARWDPQRRMWLLPYTAEAWQSLSMTVAVKPDARILQDLTREELDTGKPAPEAPPMPLKSGITPFRHQAEAYAHALLCTAYAFLFEMGCGKSLTAVAVAGQLFLQGKIRRVLVVAPLAVCPVWPREFSDYAGFPYTAIVLEGTAAKKKKALAALTKMSGRLQVAVINYESAWRMETELFEFAPDLVICDESQRIKDPMSKQSKALHRLGDQARYRLILSGTPVTNSPLDFYSQYRFLDRDIFGESWYAFRARYAVTAQDVNHNTGKTYTRVVGYRSLPELTEKAHSIAYRVTKANALDLPEQLDQYLYCELEPAARKAYNDLARESMAELAGLPAVTTRHVITRLLRLSQIAGGFVRVDVDGYEDDPDAGKVVAISKAKQKLFEETARDILENGKKLVVFARFTAEIHAILTILDKLCGRTAVRLIDGSVPGPERGQAVEDFQKNPDVRVFVAQIQTAGLGITLTAADTAIFYSFDYSYANYQQAKARIHRIGQKNNCTYLHLVARDTVDEEVLTALKHKGNVADLCVDNWRTLLKGGDRA